MTPLPRPPVEVPRQSDLLLCAPRLALAVHNVVAEMKEKGFRPRVYETLRTDARQRHLYGYGREYDDPKPRGIVTNSATSHKTWHGFGLAADIVEDDATPWVATPAFWNALGTAAEKYGLTWGGRWQFLDLPHVQWGVCRRSPSPKALELYTKGGYQAVWRAVAAL